MKKGDSVYWLFFFVLGIQATFKDKFSSHTAYSSSSSRNSNELRQNITTRAPSVDTINIYPSDDYNNFKDLAIIHVRRDNVTSDRINDGITVEKSLYVNTDDVLKSQKSNFITNSTIFIPGQVYKLNPLRIKVKSPIVNVSNPVFTHNPHNININRLNNIREDVKIKLEPDIINIPHPQIIENKNWGRVEHQAVYKQNNNAGPRDVGQGSGLVPTIDREAENLIPQNIYQGKHQKIPRYQNVPSQKEIKINWSGNAPAATHIKVPSVVIHQGFGPISGENRYEHSHASHQNNHNHRLESDNRYPENFHHFHHLNHDPSHYHHSRQFYGHPPVINEKELVINENVYVNRYPHEMRTSENDQSNHSRVIDQLKKLPRPSVVRMDQKTTDMLISQQDSRRNMNNRIYSSLPSETHNREKSPKSGDLIYIDSDNVLIPIPSVDYTTPIIHKGVVETNIHANKNNIPYINNSSQSYSANRLRSQQQNTPKIDLKAFPVSFHVHSSPSIIENANPQFKSSYPQYLNAGDLEVESAV